MTYNLGPLGQQTAFSAAILFIGLLSVGSVLYTVTKVLLSIFILPGKSVRKTSDDYVPTQAGLPN